MVDLYTKCAMPKRGQFIWVPIKLKQQQQQQQHTEHKKAESFLKPLAAVTVN